MHAKGVSPLGAGLHSVTCFRFEVSFMGEILHFPVPREQQQNADIDAVIDRELQIVPERDRELIRFELIKTIDSYDAFFTEWSLTIPKDSDKTLKKQIYDIAHEEHGRKMKMLKDIMTLKVKVLVAEYFQHR